MELIDNKLPDLSRVPAVDEVGVNAVIYCDGDKKIARAIQEVKTTWHPIGT